MSQPDYDFAACYQKYLAAKPLTDNELRAFRKDLALTGRKIWEMGMEKDPLFLKVGQAIKDAYHMYKSRKEAGKWNPTRRLDKSKRK